MANMASGEPDTAFTGQHHPKLGKRKVEGKVERVLRHSYLY